MSIEWKKIKIGLRNGGSIVWLNFRIFVRRGGEKNEKLIVLWRLGWVSLEFIYR